MPLTEETRRTLLDYGAMAPSGDNLQPWLVDWPDERTLRVEIDRTRDRSLYNFDFRASLIALGAFVENISIAAAGLGQAASVDISTRDGSALPGATIAFRDAVPPTAPDPLADAIPKRCTNRKPFTARPLAAEAVEALRRIVPAGGPARLRFVDDPRQKRVVARAASLNDRLLFVTRPLHDSLYATIRWTEEEARATRDGLFVKTLELGPMGPGFKAMRSWGVVRVARAFGAALTAPIHSYQTFVRSPAFGFLQMDDTEPRTFVEGGRLIQRIWLTATAHGLAFQPMAGTLCLLPYLRAGQDRSPFGSGEMALLGRAERLFEQVLPLDDRKATILLFRVGYGPQPTATSMRRPMSKYSVLAPRDQ